MFSGFIYVIHAVAMVATVTASVLLGAGRARGGRLGGARLSPSAPRCRAIGGFRAGVDVDLFARALLIAVAAGEY